MSESQNDQSVTLTAHSWWMDTYETHISYLQSNFQTQPVIFVAHFSLAVYTFPLLETSTNHLRACLAIQNK